MKRKVSFILGSLITIATPIALVASCSTNQGKQGWNQGNFLESRVQENKNKAHISMPEIRREKIKTYNQDLSSSFGVPLVSGGFGEIRHFYSTKNKLSIHIGDDVFTKAGTKIHAPFNGEVIAVWGKSKVSELGGGLGTQVIMRVAAKEIIKARPKLKDSLKNEECVFLTFGHLSLDTPTLYPNTKTIKKHIDLSKNKRGVWNWSYNASIDFKHTFKVTKGQVIGKVGSLNENGGWIPHVHVEAFKGSSQRFKDKILSKYVVDANWTDQDFMKLKYRTFSNIKGLGVFMVSNSKRDNLIAHWKGGDYTYTSKTRGSVTKTITPEKSFVGRYKIIDPNLIYKLWDKDSKQFTLK